MTDRASFFVETVSAADAVTEAKRRAREAGLVVRTVARVVYVERPTGWVVTLAVRP